MLFLADILPTSYEVGVLAGRVRPGDAVAIVGAGPIGLGVVATARLFTPDTAYNNLGIALYHIGRLPDAERAHAEAVRRGFARD